MIEPSVSDFEPKRDDSDVVIVAKAEIRGALAAFAAVEDMFEECMQLAIEHELHDDLLTGLVAMSEDLRLHVRDHILPLRRQLP